ncbi:hypothetical protein DFJ73DRAFT_867781 [Zopfochytrium polystomum]|nr:hypothetical protein DFJ73DRAFT_867781 [Zopfochytrium polystomum]
MRPRLRAKTVAASGAGPSPRVGASMTYLPSTTTCAVFGGASHEEGFRNDLYLLNFETKSWTEVKISEKDLPTPRYEHCAAAVKWREQEQATPKRECLFVFGGSSEKGLLNDCWIFDFEKQKWHFLATRGRLPNGRNIQSCGYIPGDDSSHRVTGSDRVLIAFGGGVAEDPVADCAVYCFLLDTQSWIQLSSSETDSAAQPPPRLGHTIVTLSNKSPEQATPEPVGRLLIWGGSDADRRLWSFGLTSRKWENLSGDFTSSHPECRFGHCAGLLSVWPNSERKWMISFGWHRLDTSSEASHPLFGRLDSSSCVVEWEGKTAMLVFGGMDFERVYNDMFLFSLE